jgi:hypothetical protein
MHEPARSATTAVSLPPASERLDIENSETAPIVPWECLTPELGDIRFNGGKEEGDATLVHGITVALPGSVGPGARAATSLLDGYPRAAKCSLSDSPR